MPTNPRLRLTLPIAAAILSLAAILLLWNAVRPHTFTGTLLQSHEPAPDFTLTGMDGEPVTLSDLRGRVVLLFFGYTSCPDVCPTTLATLKNVLVELGNKAGQFQPLFISVDPETDTPERLKAFTSRFDPRILGLTGDLDALKLTATQYGVYFEKLPFGSEGGYTIDHTATSMVIDQNGYLRLLFPYGTPAQAMAEDILYIINH
jgi:protein SCO1/2